MSYDSASWGALALALTVLGGVITYFRWRVHGLASLLRGTAWSIVPLAAWMTGVLELAADISSDVSRWAVHLVFSPLVWLGICLAGVAVVLFGAGTMLRNRTSPEIAEAPESKQLGSKQLGSKRTSRMAAKGVSGRGDDDIEGMDDIAAILRKHGIS